MFFYFVFVIPTFGQGHKETLNKTTTEPFVQPFITLVFERAHI